jgi:hypothetical protein
VVLGLINVSQIKSKADHEEDNGRLNRCSAKNIAGFGAESGLHGAATHGRAHAAIRLGPLHEYHQHEEQRSDDQNES